MKRNNREAEIDSPENQYRIGMALYQKHARDEAVTWLEKAAGQGYPLAMDALGMIYFTQKDLDQALRYWSMAVELGYPDAKNNLGWLYYSGQGVAQNFELAYKLHSEAASSSCTDDNVKAEAAKVAAVMSFNGEGTEKSLDQAIHWLKIAANLGMFSARIMLQKIEEEKLDAPIGKLISIDLFKLYWDRQILN